MPADTIAVYCDDESTRTGAHKGQRVQVITLHRDSSGDWYSQQPSAATRHHRHDGTDAGRMHYVSDDGARVGHHPQHAAESPADPRGATPPVRTPDEAHRTFRLRCERCDLARDARAAKLAPILEKLRHVDLTEISLTQLANMLS